MLRAADVGAERPQAADEDGHLRRGQVEHVGAVDEQHLRLDLLAGAQVVAEPVGARLEDPEGLDVGLLLRGVGAARVERHGHLHAGVPRRLLDGGGAGQHDQVGQRDLRAAAAVELPLDALEGLQDRAQLLGLVDLPAALRLEPDPGAVGAAALVGGAEARGGGPGGGDQLGGGETGLQDLRLEGGDVGVTHELVVDGRHRVLPQLGLGDPRPEEAPDRTHVAVQQLVPGLGEGQRELVGVLQEAARDLLVRRVEAQRQVGGEHRRLVVLRRGRRRPG